MPSSAKPPAAAPPGPLLAVKLHPPATSPAQVLRTAVRERVCAPSTAKLVVVRAPAGFGKTTAMAQCRAHLQQRGTGTAWLTLDAADNDPSRFLVCLGAALSGGIARSGASGGLHVVDDLAAHEGELVLFLDELELIHDSSVLSLLREIVDRLPRRARLVVGSRGLPDLGLGRLRVQGQLLEVDTDSLRFSLDETAEFLQTRRGLPLQMPDLLQLHQKTEGWVAALWLASLALERREARSAFITRFSGSNEALADYLADDVLSRQTPALRDFLLRTSILRQLHAPLCDALVPGGGSAAMLAELEAANVFVTPIEGEDGTSGYRYHALFAGFLMAQLAREQPGAVRDLHRAASRWYETDGRPVPAIDHAIEAGEVERALALLSRHAEGFLAQGRLRLLTRWFGAVPDAALTDRPALQVVRAWALCFTHGPWDAMALLERLPLDETRDPETFSKLLALRPALLAMMDRYDEAWDAGIAGLRHLPPEQSFAHAVLSNAMAHVFFVHGRYAQARQQLDTARQGQGRHPSRFNVMYSESVEGLIDLQEGRMRQAAARFRMAVHAGPVRTDAGGSGGNAWAGVLHALAVYESGDLAKAERLLHVYVPLARDVGLPDHMILGCSMLARMAFYRGDVDRAFQWLIELEYLGHQRQLPRVAASARLERARLLLMQGHVQAAAEALARANVEGLWQRLAPFRLPTDVEDYVVGELRLLAYALDAPRALKALPAEIARARQAGSHRRALKLCLILTVAQHRSGDRAAALSGLRTCLAETCAEDMVRLVVDEGEALGRMVCELVEADARGRTGDPLFADYLQRLCRGFGLQPAPPEAATPVSLPLEPLTAGEMRVLQLLAEGDSNSTMAGKLFVSDSTVRTHLRNINCKLDAASRTQAAAVARRLGLVR